MAEPLTGIRIVIAEDHDDTRDIMEQALRHLGDDDGGCDGPRGLGHGGSSRHPRDRSLVA